LNLATSYRLKGAELQTSTTVSDAPDAWNLELFAVIPGVPLHLREVVDTRTYVQEIRLVSKTPGPLSWVTGLYYLKQTSDQQDALYLTSSFVDALGITSLLTNVAPGASYSNDLETKENSELAAYGEASPTGSSARTAARA